jgi:hypothetical protein
MVRQILMRNWWEIIPGLVPLVQTLLWVGLIGVLIYSARRQLLSVITYVDERMRLGASFKIGPAGLELGALATLTEVKQEPVTDRQNNEESSQLTFAHAISDPAAIKTLADWHAVRQSGYRSSKEYFVVHVITPTSTPSPVLGKRVFHVAVYVKRHFSDDLSDIAKAEFFLGKWWGNKVVEEHVRDGVIGIQLSAYGEVLCICRLTLKGNGEQLLLSRYIDFEMGKLLN